MKSVCGIQRNTSRYYLTVLYNVVFVCYPVPLPWLSACRVPDGVEWVSVHPVACCDPDFFNLAKILPGS